MSRRLVAPTAKLSTLGGDVVEREAEWILDSQLKRLVRRPLPRTSRPSGLLPVTLFPVCRGRRINTMKIRPVLAIIPIVVGVPVAA
jgi:hypothetical protein